LNFTSLKVEDIKTFCQKLQKKTVENIEEDGLEKKLYTFTSIPHKVFYSFTS